MSWPTKVVETASLPQYQTPHFMERFLDAAHHEGREIERSPTTRGIKLVDGSEMVADALDYFDHNKPELEREFHSELSAKMGAEKTDLFCDVVANDWYDGKGLRSGVKVRGIKQSVRRYLVAIMNGQDLSSVVVNDVVPSASPLLSEAEIGAVLTVNDQLMMRHIEAWKMRRSDSDRVSDHDVFFKRGLSLENALDGHDTYREWDYINPYSLAFSAPEKFSQMQKEKAGICRSFTGDFSFSRPLFQAWKLVSLRPGSSLRIVLIRLPSRVSMGGYSNTFSARCPIDRSDSS